MLVAYAFILLSFFFLDAKRQEEGIEKREGVVKYPYASKDKTREIVILHVRSKNAMHYEEQ